MGDAGSAGSDGTVQTLPPITDYTQEGPFATTEEANTGPSGNYTIFRPDPLGADGFLHSPIIFGPGIITSPSSYRTLLTHLASHGFVTLCVNSLTGGPNAPGNLTAMEMGLDWLIAQDSEAGTFEGKLAVDRAVTMGYSIGSTASVQLSSHAAILTTVAIHGHNTMGDPHGPVLLLTGTMDVIDDVRDTLTTLEEAPAMLAALPIGHLTVLSELSASGRYLGPITAWLRYWVNGDEAAKSFFWGADCEMCSSPWITPETNAAWDAQTL
jgi:dienelactone hydrolase